MPSRDGILGKILDRILGRIRRIAGSQLPPTASKGSWQHQIISTMIHSATVTTKTRFVRRLIIKLFFESVCVVRNGCQRKWEQSAEALESYRHWQQSS